MKPLMLITLIFLSMSVSAQTPADDLQIKNLVQTLEDGWTQKDGNLFAKPFAENADYVVVNGMYIKGRPAIAGGHQGIFNSVYKETFIKTNVTNIRYLRPDIAVAHADAHMTGTSNGQVVDRKARMTLMVEKTKSGWEIAAFHNTNIEEQR